MRSQLLSWWQKIKKHPVSSIIIFTAIIVVIALIIVIVLGYRFNWTWTGLGPYTPPTKDSNFQRGKTLWDWLQLLVIPAVLAIAGYIFTLTTSKNERDIALDSQRETVLQDYIDKLSELLLEKKLCDSQTNDEVRKIASVRTLTVLPRLDANRKKSVLQFLYESGLINKSTRIINLTGADLGRADLSKADLRIVDLTNANLTSANFRQANLRGADLTSTNLRGAILKGANLRGANLAKANLSGANLTEACLIEADLSSANLSNANLRDATIISTTLTGGRPRYSQVTTDPLDKAESLKGATMPDGTKHP